MILYSCFCLDNLKTLQKRFVFETWPPCNVVRTLSREIFYIIIMSLQWFAGYSALFFGGIWLFLLAWKHGISISSNIYGQLTNIAEDFGVHIVFPTVVALGFYDFCCSASHYYTITFQYYLVNFTFILYTCHGGSCYSNMCNRTHCPPLLSAVYLELFLSDFCHSLVVKMFVDVVSPSGLLTNHIWLLCSPQNRKKLLQNRLSCWHTFHVFGMGELHISKLAFEC